jgi:hypothetical protein
MSASSSGGESNGDIDIRLCIVPNEALLANNIQSHVERPIIAALSTPNYQPSTILQINKACPEHSRTGRKSELLRRVLILPFGSRYNGAMADEITPPPPPVPQAVPRTAPAAIWSLVLAVLSFTCGWLLTAIPAVICGHIARSKIRKSGGTLGGKGIATAGLVLGYIALVLGVMGIPLLVSMIQSDRERLHRLSTERKEIVDGKIKVMAPGTWTKLPKLNEFASLQVGDKGNRIYLIVITEAKADVPKLTL